MKLAELRSRIPITRADAALLALALLAAYALKRYYSAASADDLVWILDPTARLVSLFTGASFVAERHVGFVSRELLFVIGPSCAGLNFLIVVFCTTAFAFIPRMERLRSKIALLAGGALASFSATVLVNAVRIVIGAKLHRSGASFAGLSAEQVHRLEGVLVYFFFLMVIFFAARSVAPARSGHVCAA